ncbi:MAG: SGNH/GDSL hydrolase family protein [Sedimentisphaerales bacterium]|nr:SGNH/GDSL hydrolase family protein [Sedimentisphaerales bacterium]
MKNKIELKPDDTIVFIGDSITDAGRCESVYKPFGYGYVHFAANWLLAKYPDFNINIINTGISGNTIRDLKSRWEKDCLKHNPDIISILIGINDVWRFHTNRIDEAVLIDEYESTYKTLLTKARDKSNCQLVLIEPFMFCNDANNMIYKDLQNFIACVHRLAEQFDAVLVPLQKSINEIINLVPQNNWSDDMVHPYIWAHCWITQRWFEATCI